MVDDVDPREDLLCIVRILLEEPDKLEKLVTAGAKVTRTFFIFTCQGECGLIYAIDGIGGSVYLLNHIESLPEEGILVEDIEEVRCVIEGLLEFVEKTPGLHSEVFMERINPKHYVPGSCFSLS